MTIARKLIIAVLKRVDVQLTTKTAAKFVPVLGSKVSAGLSFTAMRLLGNRHVDGCYRSARSTIELKAPERPPLTISGNDWKDPVMRQPLQHLKRLWMRA